MKVIVVLALVSIFAAIATIATAYNKHAPYKKMTKLTCEKNVKAIIAGKCNADSTATYNNRVAFPIDSCVHVPKVPKVPNAPNVPEVTRSMKFTVTGADITFALWTGSNVCEGTPLKATFEDNVCSGTSIYKIYEGEVIEMESHGTDDNCSDVKPFNGGMKIIPDRCFKKAISYWGGIFTVHGVNGKMTCSSDHDTITWQHYTDEWCETSGEKEEHKSGKCFSSVPDKATTGKPFLMLTLALPVAVLLFLQ